jgi:hypothetical protein
MNGDNLPPLTGAIIPTGLVPWRRNFDAAHDPYAARNALGLGNVLTILSHAPSGVLGRVTAGVGDLEFINGGQFPATSTNDSASAGRLGEYLEATQGTPQALTTNTALSITSISLTAGDWDVRGIAVFSGAATTTVDYQAAGIGTTINALPAALSDGSNYDSVGAIAPFNFIAAKTLPVGPMRVSLTTTTTYYLTVLSGFAVSTQSCAAHISARRVR